MALAGPLPHPKRFRQSMFQGLALGIKGLLSRWRNRNVSSLRKDQSESLENVPGAQTACFEASELVRQVLSDQHPEVFIGTQDRSTPH
jgi:hypothetical protein